MMQNIIEVGSEHIDILELIRIIREANQIIMNHYNGQNFSVSYKNDNSPVTDADKASSNYIIESLYKKWPKIPILSEEATDSYDFKKKKTDLLWLVDPIDGTREFIKHNGEFTCNIALCYKGRPYGGVVSIPVYKKIYFGFEGMSAYRGNENDDINLYQKIQANKFSFRDPGLKVLVSKYSKSKLLNSIVKKLNSPKLIYKGSSWKILMVSEGSADIYVRTGLTSEWDTAAAHAILNCAGGEISALTNDKQPLKYNKEEILNSYFICYGRASDNFSEILLD